MDKDNTYSSVDRRGQQIIKKMADKYGVHAEITKRGQITLSGNEADLKRTRKAIENSHCSGGTELDSRIIPDSEDYER